MNNKNNIRITVVTMVSVITIAISLKKNKAIIKTNLSPNNNSRIKNKKWNRK